MADVDLLLCPCKMKTVGVRQNGPTITCCGCSLKWHVRCVGLHGMSTKEAAKYTEWRCPKCYVLPLEESDFQANDPTLHENIKSEVMKILPALVATVVQETQKQSAKTYASVVKEAQESLIMDCFEKSSATVVARVCRKSKIILSNGIAVSVMLLFVMYQSAITNQVCKGEIMTWRKCKTFSKFKIAKLL